MLIKSAVRGAFGPTVLALVIISSPLAAHAQVATSTPVASTTQPVLNPYDSADVAAAVASYFADVPAMSAIAKCESGDRQFDADDHVLSGGSGGMLGVFQINGAVHKAFALTLGDDIDTLAGNMAYARYLYSNEGTEPWDSSKFCWGGQTQTQILNNQTTAATLSGTLKLGSVSSEVTTLQKLLNGAGYYIAKTGAGSPGHEGNSFGALTLAAVERFQCANGIACKGTPATTGYGLVGAKTRAALMLNS